MNSQQKMDLLNSAFMSEWLDSYCFGVEGEEEQFELVVIEGLNQRFVAVVNSGTFIDRL